MVNNLEVFFLTWWWQAKIIKANTINWKKKKTPINRWDTHLSTFMTIKPHTFKKKKKKKDHIPNLCYKKKKRLVLNINCMAKLTYEI